MYNIACMSFFFFYIFVVLMFIFLGLYLDYVTQLEKKNKLQTYNWKGISFSCLLLKEGSQRLPWLCIPKLFSHTFLRFNRTTYISSHITTLRKGLSIRSSSKNYKKLGKYKLDRYFEVNFNPVTAKLI